MDLKSMQVNASKRVTRMTKRGVEIRTDQTGRQCLDALSNVTWLQWMDERL